MTKGQQCIVQIDGHSITGTVVMVSENYFVIQVDDDQPVMAGEKISF